MTKPKPHKTHCKRGHEFPRKRNSLGFRFCPICRRASAKEYYLQNRERILQRQHIRYHNNREILCAKVKAIYHRKSRKARSAMNHARYLARKAKQLAQAEGKTL